MLALDEMTITAEGYLIIYSILCIMAVLPMFMIIWGFLAIKNNDLGCWKIIGVFAVVLGILCAALVIYMIGSFLVQT